ncbi:MAG: hypothetical protein ACR2JC_21160 [Chloroflexota bacterium]
MLSRGSFDVDAALAPARRTIGLALCAVFVLRGLIVGGIAGVVILVGGRLSSATWSWPALAAMTGGALVGLALGVRRWPDSRRAARAVDRHFGLGDRLTTALEYRTAADPLLILQRADAARAVRGLPTGRVTRARPSRREMASGLGALAAFLTLVVWVPSSHATTVSASTPAVQQRIRQVARTSLPAISRFIGQSLTPSEARDPALARLRLALDRLQRQLLRSRHLNQALRAISLTQQQLHRGEAGLHPVSRTSVAQLNHSLGRYLKARSDVTRDAAHTASTLSHLADSLQRMHGAQKSQLARALAQAANTSGDRRLRSDLRKAATSLGHGDTASATVFLKQAAALLRHTPAMQRAQSRLRTVSSRLGNLKNILAALRRGQQYQKAIAKSQSQGSNVHQTPAQSARTGTNTDPRKTSLSRVSAAHGPRANGAPSRAGRSPSTTVGRGRGERLTESNGTSTQSPGKSRGALYIHGRETNGTRFLQKGRSGSPSQAAQQRYRQILVRYAQSARTALERMPLPPDVQAYVRQYFDQISR